MYCGNTVYRLIMLATPGVVGNDWPGAEQNPAYSTSVKRPNGAFFCFLQLNTRRMAGCVIVNLPKSCVIYARVLDVLIYLMPFAQSGECVRG